MVYTLQAMTAMHQARSPQKSPLLDLPSSSEVQLPNLCCAQRVYTTMFHVILCCCPPLQRRWSAAAISSLHANHISV